MTNATVANILEAEIARRSALLAGAVSAMKPVIDILLELRDAGFEVGLRLDPPVSMTAENIEGRLECPQLHSSTGPEDRFCYSIVLNAANGAMRVNLDTGDGQEYDDPSWSGAYAPAGLSQAILDAAVQRRLAQQANGGGFRL